MNQNNSFRPLTSIRRILDMELPEQIKLTNGVLHIPSRLNRKDISYTYLADENTGKSKLTRSCWITQPLSHILNSTRFIPGGELYQSTNPEASKNIYKTELANALSNVYSVINRLVKDELLKDRKGPGFMAFVQSNENVPEDCILISDRTYNSFLLPDSDQWRSASHVVVTRYPNLGPNTTCEVKVLVRGLETGEIKNNEFTRKFADLQLEPEQEEIMDCVYLHPAVLKDMLQGDGDGDTVFCYISRQEGTAFADVNLTRKPGTEAVFAEEMEKLIKKGNRNANVPLSKFLPQYFDKTPIGPATYAIRYQLYLRAKQLKAQGHDSPLHQAWTEIAPNAIELIEFVMDIRKGEYTPEQIQAKLDGIRFWTNKIQEDKERDWFAKAITASSIPDVAQFLNAFPTLQSFINQVYVQ